MKCHNKKMQPEIQTSVICTGIATALLFVHSLITDSTDPDTHISDGMFVKVMIIVLISTYCTLRFLSNNQTASITIDQNW